MKKLIRSISYFFAILTLIFGLLIVPSIQDYAYSNTMDLLTEECTVITSTAGWNAFGACWTNNGICKFTETTVPGSCDELLQEK